MAPLSQIRLVYGVGRLVTLKLVTGTEKPGIYGFRRFETPV